MTTPGTRLYFALAAIAWVGALVYGVGTGGTPLGVLSLGWSGGVGDHLGYGILIGLAATAFAVGALTAVLIDLLPRTARSAEDETLEEAPVGPAPWPVVAAFGAGLLLVGAVSEPLLFIVGAVVLGATLLEWVVQSWADQATGDQAVNASIRSRLMSPIEVPAIGVLIIAFVVLGLSRVMLAASKEGSAIIAIAIGVVVLGVAVLIGTRKLSANVISGLLLAGAAVVLVGGIVGAAVGERDFEHHGDDHSEDADEHGDDGGFQVNTPFPAVAPTGEQSGRTEPAEGNTPAEHTPTTVAAEEGE